MLNVSVYVIITFPKHVFHDVPEWWLDAVFAWETTRQGDNMAASEWEDASCLNPCPPMFFLFSVGVCLTLLLTLPLTTLKKRKPPNKIGILQGSQFTVYIVIFPLSYCTNRRHVRCGNVSIFS